MKFIVKLLTVKVLLTGIFLFLSLSSIGGVGLEVYPAWYTSTANLNIRSTPSQYGKKIVTVPKGTRLKVNRINFSGWAEIEHGGWTAYCSSRYLTYSEPYIATATPQRAAGELSSKTKSSFGWGDVIGAAFWIGTIFVVLSILRKILLGVAGMAAKLFYKGYLLISLPFYFLNWLQRFLAKPLGVSITSAASAMLLALRNGD